jgi:hypothetical protein
MYSFMLLKIHGQDRAVYFLAIPSEDWLRAIDAWPSSPQRHLSTDTNDKGSESHGTEGDDAQTEYVHNKLRGKWPIDQEPSAKRRKMTRPFQGEEGLVSIGGSNQP